MEGPWWFVVLGYAEPLFVTSFVVTEVVQFVFRVALEGRAVGAGEACVEHVAVLPP